MGHLKNVFQRKETKYVMNIDTYQELRQALEPYLKEDEYGLHTIISVYYDTANFELIRRSIEKPNYREKFRLRSYSVPTNNTPVFLEIKKKINGIVYKRRIQVSYEEAVLYNYQHLDLYMIETPRNQQIKREMDWLLLRKKLTPKVMIAYDRIAMTGKMQENAEFRVTFDFNIRYRTEHFDLRTGDDGALVAPEIDVLMEVKALGAYPILFSQILSELGLFKESFSKYAQTYLRYLNKEELLNVQ